MRIARATQHTPSRIGACTLPVVAHSNTAAALDAVDAQASSSNTITAATMGRTRPTIGNKQQRAKIWAREKTQKREEKDKRKEQRRKKRSRQHDLLRDGGELGEGLEPALQPRTLENTREEEPTRVLEGDAEILRDEADDEFAAHEYREGFSGEPHPDFVPPKVLVTTRPRPSKELFRFVADLISVVPNAFFYPRRHFSVQDICRKGSEQNFSHVIVLSERAKKCNGLILSKLPQGPTAFFKVSNVQVSDSVPGAGRRTEHQPEILLNNFTTRLGRRVGRMLSSLFYSKPAFQGRQCVTFHNQRDYIFVRHHRYIFEERPVDKRKKKVIARLQELGPRFTLRLRWLQDGTFDTKFGAYEWLHRRKQMDVSRRKFHL